MLDLDLIIEAIEACRDREWEFVDTCEYVSRKFNLPLDFIEAVYDSCDGVELDADKWWDVLQG